MRFITSALLATVAGCTIAPTAPGEPNSCVSEAMTEGKTFELKGKPYEVVKVFGAHANCMDVARPLAAEIREKR